MKFLCSMNYFPTLNFKIRSKNLFLAQDIKKWQKCFLAKGNCVLKSMEVSMDPDRVSYCPLLDFKTLCLLYLIASFETYILLRFVSPFSCIKLQDQINFSCVSSDLWKVYQIHLELSTTCLNYTEMFVQ